MNQQLEKTVENYIKQNIDEIIQEKTYATKCAFFELQNNFRHNKYGMHYKRK